MKANGAEVRKDPKMMMAKIMVLVNKLLDGSPEENLGRIFEGDFNILEYGCL